jgi:hypothetical protein
MNYILCLCNSCKWTARDESGGNSGLLWEFHGDTIRRVRSAIVHEHLGPVRDPLTQVWPAIAPQWRDCVLQTYSK